MGGLRSIGPLDDVGRRAGRHGYWRRRFRAGDALHGPAPLSRAETAGPGGILVRLGVRQTRIPGRHGRPARELGSLEGPPRCQGIRSRTLTLGTATFGTITGESAGYPTGWILALYGVSILALIAFIFVEHRAENPMLNLSFFRRPSFAGSTLVATTTYFAIFSVFFSVALRLEVVGSASPYPLALDFLPLFGGMVLASLFTGRWVAAVGTRTPMTVGCITADRYEITPVARTKKFTALITLSRVTWSNPHEFSTDS